MKPVKFLVAVSLLMICATIAPAQDAYTPTAENLGAREWFQKARFGLFIHWGVYSVLGDGEWVMNNQQIPAQTYEKLPTFFNPTAFDPKEWVDMARAAIKGVRQIAALNARAA